MQGTLLVIDDDPDAVNIIRAFLRSEACSIEVACTGEGGWALLRDDPSRFDAVLLDRYMPGIDGLDILVRMKHHDRLRHLPVIIQTAADRMDQVQEGLVEGAYQYLTKPYDRATLVGAVRHALSESPRHPERLPQEA